MSPIGDSGARFLIGGLVSEERRQYPPEPSADPHPTPRQRPPTGYVASKS